MIATMPLNLRLEQNLQHFIPSLRLGIDIGQWAGGIALVQDRRILHAETYVDYHATTLEDRRTLRRGRRTRHSKKMRVARLRSWVMRQPDPSKRQEIAAWRREHPKERLPHQLRLPDPYRLMSRHCFQCQPTEYRQTVATQKPSLGTWVEAAVKGALPDGTPLTSEGFVVALTQLFQKRGFVWGGSDLSEMSDKELSQELDHIRLTPEVALQIEREVQRRRENPQSEREGKIPDFEKRVADALCRQKQNRVAEHRSIVESDLREVVKKFTSAHSDGKNKLCDAWIRELLKLLNKPLRLARFENRVISGCSWCSKNTPRKYKVREDAYKAAVRNIRIRIPGAASGVPLNEQQRQEFLSRFYDPEFRNKTEKVRQATFERMLSRIRAQEALARQLAELTGNNKPTGRTNLCQQHLRLASEGSFQCYRHRAICKLSGGSEHETLERIERLGPAVRTTRNPCREAHDKRLIQRIEQIIFDGDKLRFGDVPSLVTIEFPKPNTAQTLTCPFCKEKLAADTQLRYRIRKLKLEPAHKADDAKNFSCPNESCSSSASGQQLRLVAERRIFNRGKVDWKLFSVPNNEAVLRKAAGGMKQKKKQQYLAEINAKCIYCGSSIGIENSQIEHIFPESRGGPFLDYNLTLACSRCNPAQDSKTNGWQGKDNRTPFEWIERDKGGPVTWQRFEERVQSLPMPQRKKEILLSKEESYPDNPTALARAGGRCRQFIEELKAMLQEHGISQDQIADNYATGKLVIQTIEGWTTSKLRASWQNHLDGRPNFPRKNDRDLHNHAQDAVVIAACPPHTWRETLFTETRIVDGKLVPGLAPFELAPDWSAFSAGLSAPLVRLLGRYRLNWKQPAVDTKFYEVSSRFNEPIRFVPLTELKANQVHRVIDQEISKELIRLCAAHAVTGKKVLSTAVIQDLRAVVKRSLNAPLRRVRVRFEGIGSPKKLVCISPKDGPVRRTRPTIPSEGALVWLREGVHLGSAKPRDVNISLLRPEPLQRLGLSAYEPPVPREARVLNENGWRRYDFIFLQDGWFRFKEFSDAKITVLPERSIPDSLAERMALDVVDGFPERYLGKSELLEYFRRLQSKIPEPNKRAQPDNAPASAQAAAGD